MPALSCRHVLFCSCEKISKIIDITEIPVNIALDIFLRKNWLK
jgi:hypothetical protein